MAALLVTLSVMAVLLGALLPQWTTLARREKEEELIFRGNQYARAVVLFQRKFANAAPPAIDVLVEQKFLRKKYKDPITGDDFQPLYANQPATTPGAGAAGTARPGQGAASEPSTPTAMTPTGGATGGIIGVTSKSKDESIKIYNGRNHYNEWAFIAVQTTQRPGGPGGVQAPGRGGPVQPGEFGQPGQGFQMGGTTFTPLGRGQAPPGGFGAFGARGDPNRPPVGFGPGTPFTPMQPFSPGQAGPGQPPQPPQQPQPPRRPGGQ
jgi:type II secretory pathway pseudopilin PulG